MKKVIKQCLSLALVAVMCLSIFSTNAEAATKKVKTKRNIFLEKIYDPSKQLKKAPSLTEGKTVVSVKDFSKASSKNRIYNGWTKIKIKKTGTYDFTLSNFKERYYNNGDDMYGYFHFVREAVDEEGEYPEVIEFKTKGGKTQTLNVDVYDTKGTSINDPLKKRTATFKCKKNQVIYIYSAFTSSKYDYTINVKKR